MTDEIVNQENLDTAVAAATSEETFDALAFFSGAALPEDTITIYADAQAGYRLAEIQEQIAAQKERDEDEGTSITDEVTYVDEDEVAELKTRLKNSGVVFRLRGLAPAAKQAIERKARASYPYIEGAENTEYNEALNASLIASTIVSVTNVKGQSDPNKWDAARVLKFNEVLTESEFAKLLLGVLKVNYIGDAIDRAVNADF